MSVNRGRGPLNPQIQIWRRSSQQEINPGVLARLLHCLISTALWWGRLNTKSGQSVRLQGVVIHCTICHCSTDIIQSSLVDWDIHHNVGWDALSPVNRCQCLVSLFSLNKYKSKLMLMCICVYASFPINFWMTEQIFMKLCMYKYYYDTWVHLNDVLKKIPPISLWIYMCIPLSLLGNGWVKMLPRQQMHIQR
jgi:hypothetical protein